MNITRQRCGDTATLTVTGVIEADNAYQLIDATNAMIEGAPVPTRLVLDVTGARVGDFAVTGLLHRLCEQLRLAQSRFELRGASDELVVTIAASGLGPDIHMS